MNQVVSFEAPQSSSSWFRRRLWRRSAVRALMLTTLGFCSCTATTRSVGTQPERDPFLADPANAVAGRAAVSLAMDVDAESRSAQAVAQTDERPQSIQTAVAQLNSKQTAQQTAAQAVMQQQPTGASVVQTSDSSAKQQQSEHGRDPQTSASKPTTQQKQEKQISASAAPLSQTSDGNTQTSRPTVKPQSAQEASRPEASAKTSDAGQKQSAISKQRRPAVMLTEFRAAEARVPIRQAMHSEGASAAGSNQVEHADEYLLDGGDRANPVHYGQQQRLGLDTEDTIAEFTDDTGQSHVRATNRVAIYAPRFGAVRTISSPRQDTSVARLASATETTRGSKLRNRVAANSHVENQSLDGIRMRARVSGLSNEQGQSKVAQTNRLTTHTKLQNAYMDLAFIGRGVLEQSDEAHLAYGVQAALHWTQDKFPMIHASDASSQSLVAQFQAQQYTGIEDEKKVKGDLRIVKIADRKFAKAGDVVTFTIRYDNLGERELRQIRIVDNLTPRLAFVDGSATSDRPGNIVVEDNAEGSEVLEFVLDGVLPGKSGGVVTFQTTVR